MRVLEYTDRPGDRTTPHSHPDSVMHTLSSLRRRLHSGDTRYLGPEPNPGSLVAHLRSG